VLYSRRFARVFEREDNCIREEVLWCSVLTPVLGVSWLHCSLLGFAQLLTFSSFSIAYILLFLNCLHSPFWSLIAFTDLKSLETG
jgi:hypothetical protein